MSLKPFFKRSLFRSDRGTDSEAISRSPWKSLVTFPWRLARWMMLTRPIRFTRFGTFYILFAIGVGAAAINTGNNLLYLILGILLGFIVISGFLSDSALWGVTTEWEPLGSLYAGQKNRFLCRASKGWFPGVAVTVDSQWRGLSRVRSFFPWIPARGSATAEVEILHARRGVLTLETCLYSTCFPFGLFQKSHTWAMQKEWIVYPRVERLSHEWLDSAGDRLSAASSTRPGSGSVPYALREYRAGDALRQVQWKASAKRGRLIIKETEEESHAGDLFSLDAWPVGLSPERMERFISFVASLLFTAHDMGRPAGLATPDRVFPPDHSRHQLHAIFHYLALVDPAAAAAGQGRPARQGPARSVDIRSLWARFSETSYAGQH